MFINPTFDNSIVSDPNAAAIEGTINSAIASYEAAFTNPITVNIYFQEMTSGLGESNFYAYDAPYSTFHAGLVANNANPAAIAALNANGGAGTTNPVNGTQYITAKSANLRAVGINQPGQCQLTAGSGVPYACGGSTGPAYDGVIGLNTSLTTVSGGTYSLFAVAEHEIDEILGLGSALINTTQGSGAYNTTISGSPSPEDLFRWSAATGGTRTLSTICGAATGAYFSYGPSTGAIAQFNNACNGADFGDWASGSTPKVQDAYATPGATPVLGPSELAALSAIGYTQASAVPEPATYMLAGVGLGYLWLRRRAASRSERTGRASVLCLKSRQ